MTKMIKKYLYFFINSLSIFLGLKRWSCISHSFDNKNPLTWEKQALSQNGEDGIIQVLIKNIKEKNKQFLEIGVGNGCQNNTIFLLITSGYSGTWIDNNGEKLKEANMVFEKLAENKLNIIEKTVSKENIKELLNNFGYLNPDLFSLDIDSDDYHILKEALIIGFKPKIVVVEYVSSWGDKVSYAPKGGSKGIYWGASLNAWKELLREYGYRFVCIESAGANAFFIKEEEFIDSFINELLPDDRFLPNLSIVKSHGLNAAIGK